MAFVVIVRDDKALMPRGIYAPLSGTIKDGGGFPIQRPVSAQRYNNIYGLVRELKINDSPTDTVTESDALTGEFILNINAHPNDELVIVAHGADGENDQIFKGVKVPK